MLACDLFMRYVMNMHRMAGFYSILVHASSVILASRMSFTDPAIINVTAGSTFCITPHKISSHFLRLGASFTRLAGKIFPAKIQRIWGKHTDYVFFVVDKILRAFIIEVGLTRKCSVI